MNGHFEVAKSAYPIGFLRAPGYGAPLYQITDMRTLEPLHSQAVPLNVAERSAAVMNSEIHTGHLKSADEAALISRAYELIQGA